jgi:hypothetical protein
MPCELKRSQNGAITNTHLRDDEIGTTDEIGYHDDTVLITEGEDTPPDAEFAELRDMLPNDIGEGATQGLPADGEADSIVPNKVVILSNTLRYTLSRRPQSAFAPGEYSPWLGEDNITSVTAWQDHVICRTIT